MPIRISCGLGSLTLLLDLSQTKDGKGLGRWVNNQRCCKAKGNLKKDREEKLISTGLKWSVLVTNSWQDMMHELKLYVKEKVRGVKVAVCLLASLFVYY